MKTKIFLTALLLTAVATPVLAAGGEQHIKHVDWSFSGPTGVYDRAELQCGLQVYRQVCAACHSMKLLSYRNLEDLGYTPEQVKSLAAQDTVLDGPNDEGEMFERPARPSDRFKSPYANNNQARAANGGALPPDLSLIVKARHGGADYVYSLMTGYKTPPADVVMNPGMHYNDAFVGHQIAMPAPLSDGMIPYASADTPATAKQYAHDVSAFLAWASDPHMEERKRTGVKVIIFLLVLTGIMYFVKKRLWAKIKGH